MSVYALLYMLCVCNSYFLFCTRVCRKFFWNPLRVSGVGAILNYGLVKSTQNARGFFSQNQPQKRRFKSLIIVDYNKSWSVLMQWAILLINSFKGEDTVLNHLRFGFHRWWDSNRVCVYIFCPLRLLAAKFIRFFYCLCCKFCCAFIFWLLVVCLCLNFVGLFYNSFLSVQCCKFRCLLDCKISWLLHSYCFNFSFLVCWLLVLRVCWFVPLYRSK